MLTFNLGLEKFGKRLEKALNQAAIVEPGIEDGGYTGHQPICLTVFDHKSDQDLAGCDITAAEWKQLKEVASITKVSVGELLKSLIKEATSPIPDTGKRKFAALTKLEVVKDEAIAVIAVLEGQLNSIDKRFPDEVQASVGAGLAVLADQTIDKLEACFTECWDTCHPHKQAA